MITARNKLRFQIAPGDRQVWAIGMVAIQWTLIENWNTSLGIGLTEITGDKAAREQFDQTRPFSSRLEQVEALAELHLQVAAWATLRALFLRIKDAKFMRDRIIHGTWSGAPNAVNLSTFHWNKPQQPFEWKLDYTGILKVVRLIDELAHGLSMFLINNAGGKTDSITLQDALRHTRRTQDPI
jgi:hypothetical protein